MPRTSEQGWNTTAMSAKRDEPMTPAEYEARIAELEALLHDYQEALDTCSRLMVTLMQHYNRVETKKG